MPKEIYTITTLNKLHEENIPYDSLGPRCIGWFNNHEDAKHAVTNNMGDMWEGSYTYAVIERVGEGLYQTEPDYELFKFNTKTMKYEPIETPEYMKHFCSFGIG